MSLLDYTRKELYYDIEEKFERNYTKEATKNYNSIS